MESYGLAVGAAAGSYKVKSFVIESQLSGRRVASWYVRQVSRIHYGGKAIGTGSGELRLKEIIRT